VQVRPEVLVSTTAKFSCPAPGSFGPIVTFRSPVRQRLLPDAVPPPEDVPVPEPEPEVAFEPPDAPSPAVGVGAPVADDSPVAVDEEPAVSPAAGAAVPPTDSGAEVVAPPVLPQPVSSSVSRAAPLARLR
jgi:hypothetical protein